MGNLKTLFADRVNRFFLVITGVLNLLIWLLTGLVLSSKPLELIILNYNAYIGINYEEPGRVAYLLPFVGLLVLIIYFFLSLYFFKKEELVSRILLAFPLIFNLVIFLALWALILVNQV